jgi:hypothetical protein
MPSRKPRRKKGPGLLASGWRAAAGWISPYALSLCKGLGACTLIALTLWGLHESEGAVQRFRGLPEHVEFELPDIPPAIEATIRGALYNLQRESWDDPRLCRRVHDLLTATGWVERVHAVGKARRGVIYAACRYRQPLAPVEFRDYFYLVDESGFRLPGRYTPGPCDLILIRGVRQAPPDPCGSWPGADVAAAVRMAGLLARQPFSGQIEVLDVDNYAGRVNRTRSQIELLTDSGARILWGSPPGEELEENTMQEKINILLDNYERSGRLDARHAVIDVSVFPDRYIAADSGS